MSDSARTQLQNTHRQTFKAAEVNYRTTRWDKKLPANRHLLAKTSSIVSKYVPPTQKGQSPKEKIIRRDLILYSLLSSSRHLVIVSVTWHWLFRKQVNGKIFDAICFLFESYFSRLIKSSSRARHWKTRKLYKGNSFGDFIFHQIFLSLFIDFSSLTSRC